MAYVRKTEDEWRIEQYTGARFGWEYVCGEDNWPDARRRLQEYRENQPEFPVRARKARVSIELVGQEAP